MSKPRMSRLTAIGKAWLARPLGGQSRALSFTSNPPPTPPSPKVKEPLPIGTTVNGASGRTYVLTSILHHRERPFVCVYEAVDSSGRYQKCVAKTVFPSMYQEQVALQRPLKDSQYVRAAQDTVLEHNLFVFPYRTENLLRASRRKDLSAIQRRRILRDALRGLAELHSHGIVHTDIKPDNILLDLEETSDGLTVSNVQIADLETACAVPPGMSIRGLLLGNHMWRSPEAHVRGKVNRPSDMFSFGLVCIYVYLDILLTRLPEGVPVAEESSVRYVLEKHFCHFADKPGIDGLQEHVGWDSPHLETFDKIMKKLIKDTDPISPFVGWRDVDLSFREIVGRMTRLGPKQRCTAAEALEHTWFKDVDDVDDE